MRAVSNTSPLSALGFIGRLSLLRSQFSEVWVPPAVANELDNHPDSEALADLRKALQNQTVRVSHPLSSQILDVLLQHLHTGEAQAIALAAEMRADVLLIDEREGRHFAAQLGLLTTGVLGILLRAKLQGNIASLKAEIRALRMRGRFFVSEQLEAKLLALAGE